jgi:hypothetical protein
LPHQYIDGTLPVAPIGKETLVISTKNKISRIFVYVCSTNTLVQNGERYHYIGVSQGVLTCLQQIAFSAKLCLLIQLEKDETEICVLQDGGQIKL